jgi:hypothetical protein
VTVGPGDPRFGRDGPGEDAAVPEPRAAPAAEGPPGVDGVDEGLSAGPAVPQQRRPQVTPDRAASLPGPPPRPRIVDEPGILGLSRLSRSRAGSRLFTWFFVLVFTLIVVQMVAAILDQQW